MAEETVTVVVLRTKAPREEWKDHKFFPTNEDNEIVLNDLEEIRRIKREFAQDLPRYKTLVEKRRIPISEALKHFQARITKTDKP